MAKPPEKPSVFRAAMLAAADGVAAGWLFLLALLWLDIGGLGTLVHGSPDWPIALITLLTGFGITFSLVGLGWRFMVLLPDED